jgi:myo-inositol-1(or 4)-monophosphatase
VTVRADELLAVADTAIDRVVPRLRDAVGAAGDGAITTKSSITDLVTAHDRWSEETLVAAILSARPDDGFLGEEGASVEGRSGVTWLIDPIDGTTNFVYGLPGCSVSIAARVDDVDVAGAVHDLVRDERFRATRGGGASLDDDPIRCASPDDLATALVATGFSYDADRRRAQAAMLVDVLPRVRDIRRMGGAAIDLCALACGRVDAYFERGLSPWDHAAGALIAAEAGVRFDDRTSTGGALAGACPAIAEAFFALVDRAGGHAA